MKSHQNNTHSYGQRFVHNCISVNGRRLTLQQADAECLSLPLRKTAATPWQHRPSDQILTLMSRLVHTEVEVEISHHPDLLTVSTVNYT